jgi:hypothetical protein
MASKKFTDLPIATSADPADVLAIVDVSTDTSKQITKEDFTKDLIPQGTFTPTVSNESGVSAVNIDSSAYQDFGTYVHYQIKCEAAFSVAGTGGSFRVDVPINSAFTDPRALWCAHNGASREVVGVSLSSPAANSITITLTAEASSAGFQGLDILIVYAKS